MLDRGHELRLDRRQQCIAEVRGRGQKAFPSGQRYIAGLTSIDIVS